MANNLRGATVPLWDLANRLSRLTEHVFKGDELFLLASRRSRSRDCEVCMMGRYSFDLHLGHHVVQQCRACGSQRVSPGLEVKKKNPLRPLIWTRDLKHARDILRYAPEARSLLHLGCARGHLLAEMKTLGWDVMGIESDEHDQVSDAPLHRGTLFDYNEDKTFDLIAIHGYLEFQENLPQFFYHVVKHLNKKGRLMIEISDHSRPGRKLLDILDRSMNLINVTALCDQLANQNIALISQRRLGGGKRQLWFQLKA